MKKDYETGSKFKIGLEGSYKIHARRIRPIATSHKSTICNKLREYARKVLFNKPIEINHRNQSADEILAELIQLKVKLIALANNFKHASIKLHTLNYIAEFRTWVLLNVACKQACLKNWTKLML